MGLDASSWAWEQEIPANLKFPLVALADWADDQWACFPSMPTLGGRVGTAADTARRSAIELEKRKLIRRVPRWRANGSQTSSLIILNPGGREIDLERYEGLFQAPDESGGGPATGGTPPSPTPPLKPEEEPSEVFSSERAPVVQSSLLPDEPEPRPRPKPVTYRGRTVPQRTIRWAEALLDRFNASSERALSARMRDGRPSTHLRQIVGALLARPDIPLNAWEVAIDRTTANPPGWCEGRQLQLGDIFGERAVDHALANTGQPAASNGGRKGGNGGILDLARRAAEGEFGE